MHQEQEDGMQGPLVGGEQLHVAVAQPQPQGVVAVQGQEEQPQLLVVGLVEPLHVAVAQPQGVVAVQDQGQQAVGPWADALQQDAQVVVEEEAPPLFGVALGYNPDHGDDDAGDTTFFILVALIVALVLTFVVWSGMMASSDRRYGAPEIGTVLVPSPSPPRHPTRPETGTFPAPPPSPPRSTSPETGAVLPPSPPCPSSPGPGTALALLPSPPRGRTSPRAAPTPPPKCFGMMPTLLPSHPLYIYDHHVGLISWSPPVWCARSSSSRLVAEPAARLRRRSCLCACACFTGMHPAFMSMSS